MNSTTKISITNFKVNQNQKDMFKHIDLMTNILEETILKYSGKRIVDISKKINKLLNLKNNDSYKEIEKELNKLSDDELFLLSREFSILSVLTNIVEDVHMTEKVEDENTTSKLLTNSLKELKKNNKDDFLELVEKIKVEPVLTSHPTQVARETILNLDKKITNTLRSYWTNTRLKKSTSNDLENLYSLVAILWQTSIIRDNKPTVVNEIKSVINYFPLTFFETLPKISLLFNELIKDIENVSYDKINNLFPIKLCSWIGADRDGNPSVNASTLKEAFERQSFEVFKFYFDKLNATYQDLPLSSTMSKVSNELMEFVSQFKIENNVREKEPYLKALKIIKRKLQLTAKEIIGDDYYSNSKFSVEPQKYNNHLELVKDLKIIQDSLLANNCHLITRRNLDELIIAVKIFGFNLMSLDTRQNSSVHQKCVHAILKDLGLETDYSNLSEKDKQNILVSLMKQDLRVEKYSSSFEKNFKEEYDFFQMIYHIKKTYGSDSINNYLISNSENVSDILEVAFLLKISNLFDPNNFCLKITPLFETIDDLNNALKIIDDWLSIDFVKPIVKKCWDNKMQILLGYSDSNKDGGYLTSSWCLYKVQSEIIKLSEKHDLDIVFFHGRGGTVGRGGGPTYDAILSLPNKSVNGNIRFTEQGEIIWSKYSNTKRGWNNFESMLAATIKSYVKNDIKHLPKNFEKIMDGISNDSLDKYLDLLNTKYFNETFFEVTPVNEISTLNLGSRPVSRSNLFNIKDLRTIPWVFSWSQLRIMLPGWYGLGTGISNFIKNNKNGLLILKELYEKWPFFKGLISNVDMLLSKTNINITKKYFEFSKIKESKNIYLKIEEEYFLAYKMILNITGKKSLLWDNPELAISLKNRVPYFDLLNLIQINLLKKNRSGNKNELIKKSIHICINGIATGLRNSG